MQSQGEAEALSARARNPITILQRVSSLSGPVPISLALRSSEVQTEPFDTSAHKEKAKTEAA